MAPRPRASPHTAVVLRALAPRASDLLAPFEVLRGDAYAFLLDSALTGDGLGRFSFAGSDPYLVLRVFGARSAALRLRDVGDGAPETRLDPAADPLDLLRALLPRVAVTAGPQDAPPFVAGAVGWLGYELAARLERVSLGGEDDLGLPDLCIGLFDRALALDHASGRVLATGLGFGASEAEAEARAAAAADALAARVAGALGASAAASASAPGGVAADGEAPSAPVRACARIDAAGYAKQVDAVKERIAAGDVYQACLTHRLEVSPVADPWAFYGRLRRENPAPFAAYWVSPEITLACSSPERFLRVLPDGEVESRPIEGTRRRSGIPAEDARALRALAASEKDRAENVMIVDLVRHDLGRVCRTGSVRVPSLCALASYATVHQLVSTVSGQLAPGRDAIDALRAAFPPGSMTGAPKIAAMNLLARLEPLRRGPYAGALGYLDVRGGIDLAVVIRTALVRGGRAWLGIGGGVVADSEPLAEWLESLDKARALLHALGADVEALEGARS